MTILALALRIINALLMIGIPCLAALMIYRRGKDGFRPIWIGAAAFILSQVGHIPFNQFLMLPVIKAWGIDITAGFGAPLWILGAAAGLSAGVFEEITRYLVFRFWLKNSPSENLPIKVGIGHGGVEAILAGLLALYALIQVLVLRGEGALAAFDPDQAALIQSQLEAYWAIPWHQSLLGAWERISAMAFHLGASLMVYKSVLQKNPLWLVIAVFGHALLNAFAVIALRQLDFILLEGIVFVFAGLWLGWAWFVRVKDPVDADEEPLPPPLVLSSAPQITSKQIEESRYD
ncbi:MAG: YhfC family intramembrane metalloprotease [Anaerolineales bacterium]|nr:YhfC family intramembrane metalloprotease [Anaerolineales bacterium]